HRMSFYRVAPDQKHIAFGIVDSDGRSEDIWLLDRARNVSSRFTFDPASDDTPVWSFDSSRIAFFSLRVKQGDIFVAPVGNPANAQQVTDTPGGNFYATSFTRDGESIIGDYNTDNKIDVRIVSLRTHQMSTYVSLPFDVRS